MKTLKNISIVLLIAFATFAIVERNGFSTISHSIFVVENTMNEDGSFHSMAFGVDASGTDYLLSYGTYHFNLKDLSGETIFITEPLFPKDIHTCIWQPPKIS